MTNTTAIKQPKKFYFDVKWLIIGIIVLFLLVFEVLPLAYLVVRGFFPDGTFSLELYKATYSNPINLAAMKNTLISAFLTMIFGVLIAFPLAWLIGRTNLYGKKFFRTLFVTTYMVPPYVGAMAWLRLLNPSVGVLNKLLRQIFNLSTNHGPLNIYTVAGMVWVLTTFYYPYAFITISRAMEKMDPSLEEASRISGATPLRTLRTVTLPLMMPSLIAAGLLVFVSAASAYGIPSIVGAPGNIHTATTRIIEYTNSSSVKGFLDATPLAVVIMVIALAVLYISTFSLGKRDYITVSGKSTRPNIVDLGKWRAPLTALISLFAILIIGVPFGTVGAVSIMQNMGKGLSRDNITWRYWKTIFTRPAIVGATKNSLIYGAIAATLGMIVVLTMAYLLVRTDTKGRQIPDFLITLGSGTPSIVIALALIMTMSGNFGINIYNTATIMIIAYMIKYMLMGMRTVVSAMQQIHPSLEEAAQISGASWLRSMKDITLPLIAPSVVAGWFLIFMPSFYELSMSMMLYSSNTKTIGYELYTYQTYHSQQMASAMATAILIMVILVNWVLNKLTDGEFHI